MDGGAWQATVQRISESQTQLSDFTFTFHFPALEEGMATQSSILVWRIPMDRGAWWAHNEPDMTEWLTLFLSFMEDVAIL